MPRCRRCGKVIASKYIFCYSCSKKAKTYRDPKGYVRFKDSDKPLHRHVAEKKLGRPLDYGEVVHHKDRNKTNNRFSNLWVCKDQDYHDNLHKKDAAKHGKAASYKGFPKKRKPFFSGFF